LSSVRVAVVGAGLFGSEHARNFVSLPDVELVAIVDTNLDHARSLAHELGVAPALREADALLDIPDLRAVSVAVPTHARGTLAPRLLAGGLGVLLEKPLANDVSTASALEEAARGRVLMVGHVLRFAEPYVRLRESLRSGAMGSPISGAAVRVRGVDHFARYPDDDLIGMSMIHDIDVITWLSCAPPVRVAATADRDERGRIRECTARILLRTGMEWVLTSRWGAGAPHDSLRIVGDRGEARIRVDDRESSLTVSGHLSKDGPATSVYGRALRDELRHFIECVRDGQSSAVLRLSDAVLAVRVCDAIRVSIEQGGAEVGIGDS